MSDNNSPSVNLGETDLNQRTTKKLRHDALDSDCVMEEMEIQDPEATRKLDDPTPDPEVLPWSVKVFPGHEQQQSGSSCPHFYMGEDEEERYEGVDALFRYQGEMEDSSPKYGPRVEISKEKYLSLIRQWRGALIIKLLSKSMNFKILDQRLRDLWQLEHGYELTDLEEDYYIVRFYSRDDYLCVLEGCPWIVMDHYLMKMKWRPKFRPTTETISSTLVWIRFMGILPELLDEETLSTMRDLLGEDGQGGSTISDRLAKSFCTCVHGNEIG